MADEGAPPRARLWRVQIQGMAVSARVRSGVLRRRRGASDAARRAGGRRARREDANAFFFFFFRFDSFLLIQITYTLKSAVLDAFERRRRSALCGTAGDLPIGSLSLDALTRPPPSPLGGSLPWVSGRGFLLLGFLPMPICEEGRGGQCRVGGWGDVRRETPPVEKPTRKSGRRRGDAGPGTRVSRADRASRALGRRWWPLLVRGFGHARELSTRGTRTSCSMCPMSSSMSDCFSSGWNASPLGPRARAIGAHDPSSSLHRAIGRR